MPNVWKCGCIFLQVMHMTENETSSFPIKNSRCHCTTTSERFAYMWQFSHHTDRASFKSELLPLQLRRNQASDKKKIFKYILTLIDGRVQVLSFSTSKPPPWLSPPSPLCLQSHSTSLDQSPSSYIPAESWTLLEQTPMTAPSWSPSC